MAVEAVNAESHLVQFQGRESEARSFGPRLRGNHGRPRVAGGVSSGELTGRSASTSAWPRRFAIHEAVAVADVAWQLAGAQQAIFKSGSFERRFRDYPHGNAAAQGRKSPSAGRGWVYLLACNPTFAYA